MFSKGNLYDTALPLKKLCLTFDDGPGETSGKGAGPKTLEIATFLHQEGISATFFVVGKFALLYPHILAHIKALGHTIGNHTYNHPHLQEFFLQNGNIKAEISRTDDLIAPYVDNKTIFFRPPYGSWQPEIAYQVNEQLKNDKYTHIGPIGWDIDTYDWEYWQKEIDEKVCAAELLKKITDKGKGIILMHDSTADDEEIRKGNLTYETLRILIPELKNKGYTFCRLDELNLAETIAQKKEQNKMLRLIATVFSNLLSHKDRAAQYNSL